MVITTTNLNVDFALDNAVRRQTGGTGREMCEATPLGAVAGDGAIEVGAELLVAVVEVEREIDVDAVRHLVLVAVGVLVVAQRLNRRAERVDVRVGRYDACFAIDQRHCAYKMIKECVSLLLFAVAGGGAYRRRCQSRAR
jgi:hypothetical protein